MATESPIRIIEASGNWPSHNDSVRFRPPSANMAIEELGLLLKGHRFQGNGGRDLIPNRSGSAPPNMEGSFAAIENLISQQQYVNSDLNFGSLNINTNISEEQLRADPAYVAYYWSNVNLNPRLPPPLVSRENRGFVRYSNNGVRLNSYDDISSSSNGSLKIPVGNLSTHKEESEDDRSPQPVTEDWAEKNGGFWSGPVDEASGSPAQLKSLVDLIQEDFPRTPSPVYNQSRSVSLESAEETVAYDGADSTSLQESPPVRSNDNIGQSSYSESLNAPNASSSSSLDSTLDVRGVESAKKNIPKTQNPEIPVKKQDRLQNIHQNLINQQEQINIQPNTTFQLPAVHPQMIPQGINHHQAYMTSANQFLHGPTTTFPATEFQQPPPLLHQSYPMTSANIFHPNLQPSPYFSPQYNLALSPYMAAGYFPHSPVPVAYDASVGPAFTSQPSSPGVDMHLNRFYNQLNYSMQPSFQDVNQRGVGVASNNPFYLGTPSNVGVFHQFPSSPIAASPRNEVRFPQSPIRSGAVFSEWQGQRFDDSKSYSFLEELKSGKGRRFELSEIAGHIVEFSSDQHGSRFIQQKLEVCNPEEKQSVFKEVLPHASKLMTDVFGNYVIQKFFEYGTPEQRKELANQLEGHILPLSLQMYGCRVIQKALEVIELEQKCKLVHELDGHVLRCVRDQNGNHVIQKCIETIPTPRIDFIISSFREQVALLSTHPYGCRVIQRVLEHCTDEEQSQFIVDEILESVCSLAQDQYGNYVTQHVLERGKEHERNQIISQLSGQFVQLSQHKFASNVVEKCLEFGDSSTREILIGEIIGPEEGQDNLLAMVKDQYANYVIQKILQMCTGSEREMLLGRIRIHLNSLKKYTYGKHIVARFEQLYGEELEMPVD